MYSPTDKQVQYESTPLVKKKTDNRFDIVEIVMIAVLIVLTLCSVIVSGISIKVKKGNQAYPIIPMKPTPSDAVPRKFAVSYTPPMTLQEDRGTCWSQAIVGMLQHSYRKNGIEKKFLSDEQYVPFSIQGYSISIIRECQKEENMHICRGLQNGPVIDSTSDGEIPWLKYLPNLYTKLYPLSLCPYLPTDEEEWTCPDLEEAVKKDLNPIRFNITNMITSYDVEETKKLLREKNVGLGISVLVWGSKYYIPCPANDGDDDKDYSPICKAVNNKVSCPPTITKKKDSDRCVALDQPGYTGDGEWYLNTRFEMEGGHAMQIVAYNDGWRTQNGELGGFVIKNSWHDQIYEWNYGSRSGRGARGSHSIPYWMSEYSTWDERMVCPNVHLPENWVSCSTIEAGPTALSNGAGEELANSTNPEAAKYSLKPKMSAAMKKDVEKIMKRYARKSNEDPKTPVDQCLKGNFMKEMFDVLKQPFEFECNPKTADIYGCDNAKYRYFVDKITFNENGLATGYFVGVEKADETKYADFIVRDVPPSILGEVLKPVAEQTEENDPDNCGYYFIPYDILQKSNHGGTTWSSTYFDIDWEDSSYLINKDKYPKYDYQYLENSVRKQKRHEFDGPLPNAKRPSKRRQRGSDL
ncbi:putative papain family cysteine protease domain containing protein [Monocercomonoides exilis]|uniref:putative papain family cysteine protease domain containing protein n=1 Tax=Monocercomonoides exilis TaxID=2049356 RepID=UPI003559A472|nr:putative papain family cysteine protease domain containing protein [Monocercomonoides exilis]|eukprot:MONOS_13026.1-p1 / transcript=MONOS_13026.1 / gene=MONOS_13026 / organism=Monocercomonoides_exilis_PA203 / gene_product=papain family cysteine protease domain containing protein / transcript_product=papain family cysteine protease domain containing protein / location=Mono_scaffold00768:12628-14987(-) / protein_length=636 / sequence_SO=supercontig / SO=protein_coding / is_pseudo=false